MRGPVLTTMCLALASVGAMGCGDAGSSGTTSTTTARTTGTAPVNPATTPTTTTPVSTPTTVATSPESPPTTIATTPVNPPPTTATTPVNPPATTPSGPSSATASALVKRFYSDYAKSYGGSLKSRGDTSPPNSTVLRARAIRLYGTDRLVAAVRAAKDFDAVLCAQNTPASIKVGGGTIRSDGVRVVVAEDFGTPLKITAVVVATASGLKIDRLVCPT